MKLLVCASVSVRMSGCRSVKESFKRALFWFIYV